MKSQPLITVIIPCYKVGPYIDQCMESVSGQTYRNLEIICVDDGSADETGEKLLGYARKDDRIKVVKQHNQGVSVARNVGLALATGESIMFVDGDDWLDLNTIKLLVEMHTEEDLIVFSYTREFSNASLPKNLLLEGSYSGEFLQRRLMGPLDKEKSEIENIDSLAPVWGKLYRKTILSTSTFKDLSEIGTWEDGLFNVEVLNNCTNVLVINKPLYHYRKSNKDSHTSTFKEDLHLKWHLKFQLLGTFLKTENKEPFFFTALNNRVCLTFLGLCLNECSRDSGFPDIRRKIRDLLNEDFYRKSFAGFKLDFIPVPWKLFFYFSKIRFAFGVTVIAMSVHFLINKKNQ